MFLSVIAILTTQILNSTIWYIPTFRSGFDTSGSTDINGFSSSKNLTKKENNEYIKHKNVRSKILSHGFYF